LNKLYSLFFALALGMAQETYGQDALDECELLRDAFKTNTSNYAFNRDSGTLSTYSHDLNLNNWNFGIFFALDFSQPFDDENQRIFLRDSDGSIFIEVISPFLLEPNDHLSGKYTNNKVISINDEPTNKINDDEIRELLFDITSEHISVELLIVNPQGQQTVLSLETANRAVTGISASVEILDISKISSNESTFTARYRERYSWKLQGLDEIGTKVFDSIAVINQYWGAAANFNCTFSRKELIDLKVWIPDIQITNTVTEETLDEKYVYYFYPSEDKDYYGQAWFEKLLDKNGVFKSKFYYQSFPFDSQKLNINFSSLSDNAVVPFNHTDAVMERNFKNLDLDEWKKTSYEYHNYSYEDSEGFDKVGLIATFNLERNYLYYLTKIYLPILIILLVSLSVLFINPLQLESRLTVSVVCFLALITYTYLVDRDLPRLSYLTIMDHLILLSYFFAAFPTFQSIYIHRIAIKDESMAETINDYAKILMPVVYLVSVLGIIFLIVSGGNADHTITALRFTT